MKLGGRRPGSVISFVDAATEEILLQVSAGLNGEPRISFRLFDATGKLISDSDGPQSYPEGLRIEDSEAQILLAVPDDAEGTLEYRLYNSNGRLLTCSDGKRTQIFGGLRLDGTATPTNRRA